VLLQSAASVHRDSLNRTMPRTQMARSLMATSR
jgi:hypothetical protein